MSASPNNRINSVLGYLAARSRGDPTAGAPGETDPAPVLRPRLPFPPTLAETDSAASAFIEESLEIKTQAPSRRQPPAAPPAPERAPAQAPRATGMPAAPPQARAPSGAPATPPQTQLPGFADATRPHATAPLTARPAATTASKPAATAPEASAASHTPSLRQPSSPPPSIEAFDAATEPRDPPAPPDPVRAETEDAPPQAAGSEPPIRAREVMVRAPPPPEIAPSQGPDRPAAQPAATRDPSAAAPRPAPLVQITIGRVEIRAAAPPLPRPPRTPAMSLDDYLARRSGAERR